MAALALRGACPRSRPVAAALPGGVLDVCVLPDDTVLLTGPAQTVFTGTVDLPEA